MRFPSLQEKAKIGKMNLRRFFLLWAVVIGVGLASSTASVNPPAKQRAFSIEESVLLKELPPKVKSLEIWIPFPASDRWQVVEYFDLVSPFSARFVTDARYGNRIISIKTNRNTPADKPYEIILSFNVLRKERTALDYAVDDRRNLPHFLKADRFVPVEGAIKELAQQITKGKKNDLEKARAIYDYLIDNLTYSRDDPRVCGIGNSLLTLKYKKGICTDYHSLFISLARSIGIPSKFEIGFPVPEDKKEGQIDTYHCWATVYIRDKGWIPIDVSEAYKHPEKRDYFFGNIDANRVSITTGRDIRLDGSGRAETLNFFVYPYIKLNGHEFNDAQVRLSFKELK